MKKNKEAAAMAVAKKPKKLENGDEEHSEDTIHGYADRNQKKKTKSFQNQEESRISCHYFVFQLKILAILTEHGTY